MSRFILDTNVVSELAPEKGSAGPNLVDWLNKAENSLFLSVVTLIEVRSGVLKMERLSPGRRQQAIAAWADELDLYFAGRLLPITRDVAEQAAVIADRNLARGLQPGWPDIVIAATAAVHGMALLTRNLRHFTEAGIPVFNPFEMLPGSFQ